MGPFRRRARRFFKNKVLTDIGNKYGKSAAQVTLRWMIQRNIVVIPKSIAPSRIKENIDVFDFELSDSDMSIIKGLDKNTSKFFDHRDTKTVERFKEWAGF